MKEINLLIAKRNTTIAKKNTIDAEIIAIEQEIKDINTKVLINECLNLFDGIGKNFIAKDRYSDNRYYSEIKGIKNIRLHNNTIVVKITSSLGLLLNNIIKFRDNYYKIVFLHSNEFVNTIDY